MSFALDCVGSLFYVYSVTSIARGLQWCFETLRVMRYASRQRINEVWRLIMSYGSWILSFDQRFRTRVRSRFVWSGYVIMGPPGY